MDRQPKNKTVKILIAGGKLQGVEAAYLARKCGFETVLIDQNDDVPAKFLCNTFVRMDLTDITKLSELLRDVDFVIPALENREALDALSSACRDTDTVFVFSVLSYDLSSSKKNSKKLFKNLDLPTPNPWPFCIFPIIAKPVFGSGSTGVKVFHTLNDFHKYFPDGRVGDNMIVEQYEEGRQYSLEVMGFRGRYVCLQVTELEIDDVYDCKRVVAPSDLDSAAISALEQIAVTVSRAINLNGIMDIEVIYNEGRFTVLEIDARLPSQTPIAVFWSTGFNIIENLIKLFQEESVRKPDVAERTSILEHFIVDGNTLEVCGEHVLAEADGLQVYSNFFGADEILTDYRPGRTTWRVTMVVTGKDRRSALEKRENVLEGIRNIFGLTRYRESSPALPVPPVQLSR